MEFHEFLVDEEGQVIGRYPPTDAPETLAKDIEALISVGSRH